MEFGQISNEPVASRYHVAGNMLSECYEHASSKEYKIVAIVSVFVNVVSKYNAEKFGFR